jgi:FkbM family methyltransferase
MKAWYRLQKAWQIARYYIDFLEIGYHKNLPWLLLQDHALIMRAQDQSLQEQRRNVERTNRMEGTFAGIHQQQSRQEAPSLSALQKIPERENQFAAIQNDFPLILEKLSALTALQEQSQQGERITRLEETLAGIFQQQSRLEALSLNALQKTAEAERRLAGLQNIFSLILEKLGTLPTAPTSPEIDLLVDLHGILTHRVVLDIGAHTGTVSARLLAAGYRVVAFEPNPTLYAFLLSRFAAHPQFEALPLALGEKDGTGHLHLASNPQADPRFSDLTLYSTLQRRPTLPGLEFQQSIPVNIRSLASLHRENLVPETVDVVKIDAEGTDVLILLGMEDQIYDVVMAEFWSSDAFFGTQEGNNHLETMVELLRKRGYASHLALCCRDGDAEFHYSANCKSSPPKSWGNIVFFQKTEHYLHALKWCQNHLPPL